MFLLCSLCEGFRAKWGNIHLHGFCRVPKHGLVWPSISDQVLLVKISGQYPQCAFIGCQGWSLINKGEKYRINGLKYL